MTRQSLILLVLFILMAVLAGLVRKVRCLEERLDELRKRVEKPQKTGG